MIDLYFAPTPNGQKITIMLEECALPYRVHLVDLRRGEQFGDAFKAISPNSKIPAIVDQDGPGGAPLALFESGAILIYLAEKTGRFLSAEPRARATTIQWLMWQMAGIGPMFGQAHHFLNYAPERIPYAVERYAREVNRLYDVLEAQLSRAPYVAGPDYTIADMAIYPWVAARRGHQVTLDERPNVRRWVDTLKARPALRRGFGVLRQGSPPPLDAAARRHLFGRSSADEAAP